MTATRPHESTLIERARRGDSYAFAQLLAPYRRRLLAHILSIVANPTDADDAMQETLICIFRGLSKFRGDACFYTWAYRIAHNCGLTFRRRRACVETHEESHEHRFHEPFSEDHGPEHLLRGTQMAAAVDHVLASMNPEFHKAIALHEFEGLSYQEVATAMICPVGTVKSRISKARSEIVARLRRSGYIAPGA